MDDPTHPCPLPPGERGYNWILPLGGCVVITLKCKFVILNEVKNLIRSMCCKTEILRLGPQNDIATQSLEGGGFGRGCRMNIILIPLIILSTQGKRSSLNNQPKRG